MMGDAWEEGWEDGRPPQVPLAPRFVFVEFTYQRSNRRDVWTNPLRMQLATDATDPPDWPDAPTEEVTRPVGSASARLTD